MRELTQDPFYELIGKEYDRCVIDYCLVESEFPYRGMQSHREAVLFAMTKVIERHLEDDHVLEEEVADDSSPWSLDFGKTYVEQGTGFCSKRTECPFGTGTRPLFQDFEKAQAHPIDPGEFLFVPTIVRKVKGGPVVYDRKNPDVDASEQIPYWYAFLEPPQWFDATPDDFRRVNDALFPEGTDKLEVYEWTTDWSNYFDDGHEWWGTACWSVYDAHLNRFVVLFASATD